MATKNLQEVFRYFRPMAKEYTFFRASSAPSRLDRFYMSHDYLDEINSIEHVASLSDHCGVLLDMKFQNVFFSKIKSTSSTYWKLNTRILKDENFAALWDVLKLQQENFSDIADWWNISAKQNIKKYCATYLTRLSRNDAGGCVRIYCQEQISE